MQVTLTKISIQDKKKDGSPMVTKKGKPFRTIGIQTKEHADKWLSGFLWEQGEEMETWQSGQQVNILVEQNGQYLNFKVPNRSDALEERILSLEKRVSILEVPNSLNVQGEAKSIVQNTDDSKIPF